MNFTSICIFTTESPSSPAAFVGYLYENDILINCFISQVSLFRHWKIDNLIENF